MQESPGHGECVCVCKSVCVQESPGHGECVCVCLSVSECV